MAGGLLTPGQERFAGTLAHETGLDPRVVGAWALAEQSGGAARGYEGRGYYNWLNIANTDSGPAGGAHSGAWRDPVSAARATAEWLRGAGPITHEYGRAAPGILSILRSGRDPMAQIAAIARSGWASSGYNGGADLRSLFNELGGWRPPGGGGGGGGAGGGGGGGRQPLGFAPNVGGGVLRSGAQTSDLLALIDALAQKPSASTSVEGLSVPKPAAEPQAGPRVPQQLPEGQATSPASLLGLIGKIGEEGSSEAPPSAVTGGQAMPSGAGIGGHAGYVNPIRGARIGRTDMGVDVSAAPGTPIRAIGNAKVLGINPGWYAGQPYVYYELLDGPRKGQVIYEAEQIAPHVRPGEFVKAGQPIGVVASHGTGIEQGFGTHGWQTRAQAEGNTGDSAHNNAPAGVAFARFLAGLR